MKFVVKEADIVCDPVLSLPPSNEEGSGRTISERNKDKKPRFPRTPCDASAFTTSSNEEKNGTAESRPPLVVKLCFYCKKPHDLDACPEFVKKTISERKEFDLAKGLCFACLQHGHLSKDCKEKIGAGFVNDSIQHPFMATTEGSKKPLAIKEILIRC